MDFIITIVLYYVLISIIIFGAFIIWRILPRDRVTINFGRMLITFGVIYIIDSFNNILGEYGYISHSKELDYINILFGAFSQLYLQYFIYNILFSKHIARKWTILQSIPIVAIVGFKCVGDYMGLFSQFHSLSYGDDFESLINNPIFLLRIIIIIIQLLYAIFILTFVFWLIPLYQLYIERTEANSARNIIWIREVCLLFLALESVYLLDAVYTNIATSIIYFAVAIYSFSRVIFLMLNNYVGNFNLNGSLYQQIGIRWSLRHMWHLTPEREYQHQSIATDKELFESVEEWILTTRAYANSDFSFKDVAEQFPTLSYNDFDGLLNQFGGVGNFQSYIRTIRIDEAIRLMATDRSDLQLKGISNEVGFESSSLFSRAFKATKGITPTQWRTQIRG